MTTMDFTTNHGEPFNQTGDIHITQPSILTIRLDPLPTQSKTEAIPEL